MGGARGLFASLGASISFVAGAALSLLAVTFVVANHVGSGVVQAPPSHALFVDEHLPPASGARSSRSDAVVVRAARAPAAKPAARLVQRRSESHALRAQAAGSRMRRPSAVAGVGDLGPAAPPAAVIPADPPPTTGDGVRAVGDVLRAAVHGTTAVADVVSAPLGPPVSQAVQNVLDLVTPLLHGATSAVGSAVDGILPRR